MHAATPFAFLSSMCLRGLPPCVDPITLSNFFLILFSVEKRHPPEASTWRSVLREQTDTPIVLCPCDWSAASHFDKGSIYETYWKLLHFEHQITLSSGANDLICTQSHLTVLMATPSSLTSVPRPCRLAEEWVPCKHSTRFEQVLKAVGSADGALRNETWPCGNRGRRFAVVVGWGPPFYCE